MSIEAMEQRDYDPTLEPESSKVWLNLIEDAQKALETYQDKADAIDKRFADLGKLAAATTSDREFQLFWANLQVLGPAVYSRPPVPVVVPRFRNRKPIPQTASELLERATIVSFEKTDVDSVMVLIRDSLVRLSRGAMWIRYEDKEKKGKKSEKVCIEYAHRRDFLHGPARNWSEVPWVAKRSWMTKDELKERFPNAEWADANYVEHREVDRDKQNTGPLMKAGVWEIWDKEEEKVIWVTEGIEDVLERSDPHLTLEGFFPCPKPAYGTVEPDSLIPVPDYVYYKDQLSEINELTARISALSDALKVKGFYSSGGEIGQAVETAMKRADDNAIMVPVSNWAAFGNSGNPIIWLPVDMVAKVIVELVTLRKQMIDDVYQITGLSDIMRGQTDPNETLGAQEIKSQYGSVRIRDKQSELIRIARDACRIAAEIMAENFDKQTLLDMTQMDLPSNADIKKQVKELEDQGKKIADEAKQQIEQAQANPQIVQQAQQNPEQAQQAIQQLQSQTQQQLQQLQTQIQKVGQTVTIEQVMELLKDQKLRPFTLDIETDSTIEPDENAQKQRATEFVTAVAGYMQNAFPLVQQMPQAAPVVGAFLKYISSQFRVGRELDTTIDEFTDNLAQFASQPKADPEAEKAKADQAAQTMQMQAEAKKAEAEMQFKMQELQTKFQIEQTKLAAEIQIKQQETQRADIESKAKLAQISAQMQQEDQRSQREEQKHQMEMQAKQQDQAIKIQSAQLDAATQAQNAQIAQDQAAQDSAQSAQMFQQQQGE